MTIERLVEQKLTRQEAIDEERLVPGDENSHGYEKLHFGILKGSDIHWRLPKRYPNLLVDGFWPGKEKEPEMHAYFCPECGWVAGLARLVVDKVSRKNDYCCEFCNTVLASVFLKVREELPAPASTAAKASS